MNWQKKLKQVQPPCYAGVGFTNGKAWKHSADPVTKNSEGKTPADYTTGLDTNGLKGKKLGIEKSALTGHEGIVAAIT